MTHDPLCPNSKSCPHDCGDCLCLADAFCQCDFIAEVREDQRTRDADLIDARAKDTHRHVGGNVTYCDQRLGDRCDITAALTSLARLMRAVAP